jgi:oligoribonuclease NrnB/cAMP/cGMP phosphodiesterase (DHH superfamily)
MTKPLISIIHNDFDGGASAICIVNHVKQKYGADVQHNIIATNYDKVNMIVERILDNPDQYEKIFIADISVNLELAQAFPENVILLDHHESCKHLDGVNKCIVDTSGLHCGATLCYKHLLMDEGLEYKHLTKLVAIARDYDLWQHKLPNKIAKNVNHIYFRLWHQDFIKRFENGFTGFTDEEKEFLKNKWFSIEKEIADSKYTDMIDGEHAGKFAVVVVPGSVGEVNEICENGLKNLKYEVIMAVNAVKSKFSLRLSKKATDAGLHAGMFNVAMGLGGGHAAASGGFFTDDAHLESICQALAAKIIELKI